MNSKYQRYMDDEQEVKIQFNPSPIPSSLENHETHINKDLNAIAPSIEHGHDSSEDEKIESHPPFDIDINNNSKIEEFQLNTIIVFDYDDTLYPTTFIKKIFKRGDNPIKNPSKWNSTELSERINLTESHELTSLSFVTYNLLKKYISNYSMGNIFIVSAACHGWIKHSLSILKNIGCYKQIYQILTNYKIIKLFRDPSTDTDPTKYKYNKFESILKYKKFIFSDNYKNKKNRKCKQINTFVSIGDSLYEYGAAGILKCFNNGSFFVHRVKFIDHPTSKKLYWEQYKLYHSCGYFENYSVICRANCDEDYIHWVNKN